MSPRRAAIVARLLDLGLPGAGMLWAGCPREGWNAVLAWTFLLSLLSTAVALLDLDPQRALVAACVVFAAMQALLWLTPLPPVEAPRIARPVAGALVLALFVGIAIGLLSRVATVVTVPDHGQWPGLIPDETLLVRRAASLPAFPARGDLAAARTSSGLVMARVVAIGGDIVEVSDATLRVGGVEVTSNDLGDLHLPASGAEAAEAKGLRAWSERVGDRGHPVFFAHGVSVAKVRIDVPDGEVFLLADNRSTADAIDSRELGPIPVENIVGRPETVLWSPGPGIAPRWERIGARWP